MSEPLIQLEAVALTYSSGADEVQDLARTELAIPATDFVALLGNQLHAVAAGGLNVNCFAVATAFRSTKVSRSAAEQTNDNRRPLLGSGSNHRGV